MQPIELIDRSLVAIFDIEGFSKQNPEHQAELVNAFIDFLNSHLANLSDLNPDAFSTGDGAIVSLGRSCTVNKSVVKRFIDFVIEFTSTLLCQGLIIRVALNYSEKDRVITIKPSSLITGQYIQIGDTINVATRILGFCEPGEIMLAASVVEFMRKFNIEDAYPLFLNEPLLTKHGLTLNTYSYNPPDEHKPYFYSPDSPAHPYKKYTSFPPINTRTLKFFMDNGLDFELKKVVSSAYDSMRYINDTKTFLSWNAVLNVLIQLYYDSEDTMYVISRNDHASGFWTQKRRNTYIRYLDAHASKCGGYINQTRIMVYDDALFPTSSVATASNLMPDDDIYHDLLRLHNTKTFYSFPASLLFKYEKIAELLFGFTLSSSLSERRASRLVRW